MVFVAVVVQFWTLDSNVQMLSGFSHVWLFVTLWTVALQAPLSTGFSRQEYWRRFHFLLQLCPSVQFSHSGVSDSLPSHGLQHTRLPCPSPTPRVYSCPLSKDIQPLPSNHLILCGPLLLSPSIPCWEQCKSFQMSQFFIPGGQSFGVSVSA